MKVTKENFSIAAEEVFQHTEKLMMNNKRDSYVNILQIITNWIKNDTKSAIDLMTDEKLKIWFKHLLPLLLDSNINIQNSAIAAFNEMIPLLEKSDYQNHPEWLETKTDILTNYSKRLTIFLQNENSNWYKIWQIFIKILNKNIISGSSINILLSIVEQAFRSNTNQIRAEAFLCWKTLVEIYLKHNDTLTEKKLKLLCIPLRPTLSKTLDIAVNKLQVWWYLLCNIKFKNEEYVHIYMLDPFFEFCFGINQESFRVTTLSELAPCTIYPELAPMIISSFVCSISEPTEDLKKLAKRASMEILSVPLISFQVFNFMAKQIINCCFQTTLLIESIPDCNHISICETLWTNLMNRIVESKNWEYFEFVLNNLEELMVEIESHNNLINKIIYIIGTSNMINTESSNIKDVENVFNGIIKITSFISNEKFNMNHAIQCEIVKNTFAMNSINNNSVSRVLFKLINYLFLSHQSKHIATNTKTIVWTQLLDYSMEHLQNSENFDIVLCNYVAWPILNFSKEQIELHKLKWFNLIKIVLKKMGNELLVEYLLKKSESISLPVPFVIELIDYLLENIDANSDNKKANMTIFTLIDESISTLDLSTNDLFHIFRLINMYTVKLNEANLLHIYPILFKTVTNILNHKHNTDRSLLNNFKVIIRNNISKKNFQTIATENDIDKIKEELGRLTQQSNGGTVVIQKKWKFNPNKLTAHQREKMRERKADIPALYNDLSQSQEANSASINSMPFDFPSVGGEQKCVVLKNGIQENKEQENVENEIMTQPTEVQQNEPNQSEVAQKDEEKNEEQQNVVQQNIEQESGNNVQVENGNIGQKENGLNTKKKSNGKIKTKKVENELKRLQINAVFNTPRSTRRSKIHQELGGKESGGSMKKVQKKVKDDTVIEAEKMNNVKEMEIVDNLEENLENNLNKPVEVDVGGVSNEKMEVDKDNETQKCTDYVDEKDQMEVEPELIQVSSIPLNETVTLESGFDLTNQCNDLIEKVNENTASEKDNLNENNGIAKSVQENDVSMENAIRTNTTTESLKENVTTVTIADESISPSVLDLNYSKRKLQTKPLNGNETVILSSQEADISPSICIQNDGTAKVNESSPIIQSCIETKIPSPILDIKEPEVKVQEIQPPICSTIIENIDKNLDQIVLPVIHSFDAKCKITPTCSSPRIDTETNEVTINNLIKRNINIHNNVPHEDTPRPSYESPKTHRGNRLNGRGAKLLNLVTSNSSPNIPRILIPTEYLTKCVTGKDEKRDFQPEPEHIPIDVPANKDHLLTFSKEVPSPCATPTSTILKRKLNEVSFDENELSAKKKRVSFRDPPVSETKEFICNSEEYPLRTSLIKDMEVANNIDGLCKVVSTSPDRRSESIKNLLRRGRVSSMIEMATLKVSNDAKVPGIEEVAIINGNGVELNMDVDDISKNVVNDEMYTFNSKEEALKFVMQEYSVSEYLEKCLEKEEDRSVENERIAEEFSQILNKNDGLRASILHKLAKDNRDQFSNVTIQENSVVEVLNRFEIDKILDYVREKSDLDTEIVQKVNEKFENILPEIKTANEMDENPVNEPVPPSFEEMLTNVLQQTEIDKINKKMLIERVCSMIDDSLDDDNGLGLNEMFHKSILNFFSKDMSYQQIFEYLNVICKRKSVDV